MLTYAVGSAAARDLRIGLAADATSLDPHYDNFPANNQIARHLFEALVAQDEHQRLVPALATGWRALDERTWEFRLREGVRFHDGSPFTADDVLFSLDRVPRVPNAPSPFTHFTRQILEVEIVDPLTVRLRTAAPAPLLPRELSAIFILSRRAASGPAPEGKTTGQLNRGEGLVGTGPFRFVSWDRGRQLVLARHEDYWGPKPAWANVAFYPIADATTRLAALDSGDLDVVENVPTQDLPRLRRDERLRIVTATSNRVIYLHLDHHAEPSPGIPDTGGKNPLKDRRVRQALSLALDRDRLVQEVMAGDAVAAADLLPWPMSGARRDTVVGVPDLERARRLLGEAGYPDGFSIILGAPNGRYVNDLRVAEAVAAGWTAIGVKTRVEASQPQAFFQNRDAHRYSAYLAGWATAAGEAGDPLRALVATPDRERGLGGTNRGRYSNPAVDGLLIEALRTIDAERRATLLEDAARLALDDFAVLPLYFEVAGWAMRRGFTYAGRTDQFTLATSVTPAP
ncbi:MAG: ABC transporter substrate-binding protein [Alphaproteobacteria bacterium]|nr:ABC transporter substrate-binding protein [Alphaproteobacteria bacterium]MCW5740617.1 ABC transporter substrate-binding protein [Alphaproteobacteria bacterium]